VKGEDLKIDLKQRLMDLSLKSLSVITKVCGIFYYLLNNIVWIANMGALNQDIIENFLGWRYIKDIYSLIKVSCESIKSFIKLHISLDK
jgi:hypothetical protein